MRRDCRFCADLRYRWEYWTLTLNDNQDLLGKSMLTLNCHAENVTDMTVAEWTALHEHIRQVRAATEAVLKPDHSNFAASADFLDSLRQELKSRLSS